MHYLAIDYVASQMIEAALVDYITDKSGPVHSFEMQKEGFDLGDDIKIM